MGGFLESLGRTNALQDTGRTLLGTALAIRKMEGEEAQVERQNAIDLEKLNMLKAGEEREAKKFAFVEKEAKEKEAFLDSTYDITVDPRFMSLPPEVQGQTLKWFASQGFTDEAGRGKVRNIQQGMEMVTKTPDLYKGFLGPVVEAKKAAVTQAWGELQDATAKGDEKKAAAAQANYKKAREDYLASSGNYEKHLSSLTEQEVIQEGQTVRKELDVSERERHNKEIEKIAKTGGGTRGGKPTALVQNTRFLESLGWDAKEAAKLLTGSKPMSRESFIGQATLRIYSNEMIPDDEKGARVAEAITFFDTQIAKGAPAPSSPKALDEAKAVEYLKKAGGDKDKAREMARKDGYEF